MSKKMLIDSAHPEETRVVVVQNNRIEEFDFESSTKALIRGNIYLAKVTRVEPSLQAAFVEYGGNRHGFLAFNEIHPDYYQIPVSDRQALLEAEAEEERALALKEREADDALKIEETAPDSEQTEGDEENETQVSATGSEGSDDVTPTPVADEESDINGSDEITEADTEQETNGSEEDESYDESPRRRKKLRQYKIQEVIKRRQIILVQVVKEERGNKGAALTSYLSLAGRYCVLMPNTARGGGISRKISNGSDRRQLRTIIESLEVPEGMGLIIRTAGSKRTKTEIKRDYEYLLRLWENVRSLTLESMAPSLVHEEGSLIKRSIRDLYTKEIESVLVEGDLAYREAKDFMRMLMPSHARNVKRYAENFSIFQKYKIEPQLDAMFTPQVSLKSGGYLVINPTEALVSIDVNSGRATRERNIENTALQTNLEAAEEVARQCRLRDLAGLIVIDFIDMEENRNNRAVEKRLKENLKSDRARVQIGRISSFGLLEMSRQRMRSGVLEGSTSACPACHGAGIIRSTESTTLSILRTIEDHGAHGDGQDLIIRAPEEASLYLLNNKKGQLLQIESQGNFSVIIEVDSTLIGGQYEVIKRPKPKDGDEKADSTASSASSPKEVENKRSSQSAEAEQTEQSKSNRRRRRRKPKEDRAATSTEDGKADEAATESKADAEVKAESGSESSGDQETPKRRRPRGRRGGRRNNRRDTKTNDSPDTDSKPQKAESSVTSTDVPDGEKKPLNGDDQTSGASSQTIVEPITDSSKHAAIESPPAENLFINEPVSTPLPDQQENLKTVEDKEPQPSITEDVQAQVVKDNKPKKSGWWRR